jgi:hypothetical protein
MCGSGGVSVNGGGWVSLVEEGVLASRLCVLRVELFALSLFLLISLLFKLRTSCLSSYILCVGFRRAGSFGFEIGSRGLAAIFVRLGLVFLVYRGRGVPCYFGTIVWWADHF